MNKSNLLVAVLLLSLPAGAAFFYESLGEEVHVVNGARLEIPRNHKRSVLGLLPGVGETSSLDEEDGLFFVYFENDELQEHLPTYVSKYGERNFNTLFSVMVFESERPGTFDDDFLYFLPASGEGVEVHYDMRSGLYQYEPWGEEYSLFFGTKNPYTEGFGTAEGHTFIQCAVWQGDPLEGSACRYYVKRGSAFFGFRISYANLHLYQELQDFFFEKLESWRVE